MPRLNQNTTIPTRRVTNGINTARLASGLLLLKGTGGGRHHPPAEPSEGRLERSPPGPRVGSVGLLPREFALARAPAVSAPCGICAGAALAARLFQNSLPACSRIAVWSSPQPAWLPPGGAPLTLGTAPVALMPTPSVLPDVIPSISALSPGSTPWVSDMGPTVLKPKADCNAASGVAMGGAMMP